MLHRILPLITLWVAMGLAAFCHGADDDTAAAEKKFSLKAPIEVTRVFYFGDGGTIGVELAGAESTRFSFCLDGRFKDDNMEEKNLDGHIFIGASYPDEKGAKEVVPGSPTERALVTLLKSIVSRHASSAPSPKDSKANKHAGALKKIIDRLEARWKVLEKQKPDVPPRYRK